MRKTIGGLVRDEVHVKCEVCEEPHAVVPPTIGSFAAPGARPVVIEGVETRDEPWSVPEHIVEANERGEFVCQECEHLNKILRLDLTEGETPRST